MKITFIEARDLGEHGQVAAGETRDNLPGDFALLQVAYGIATEAHPRPAAPNPLPAVEKEI